MGKNYWQCDLCGRQREKPSHDRLCYICRGKETRRDRKGISSRSTEGRGLLLERFEPQPGIPLEEYDFNLGSTVQRILLDKDLAAGNIPPGYVFRGLGERRYMVVGQYGRSTSLIVIEDK